MRIKRPRGLRTSEIVIAIVIGVFGGAYIWKPAFHKYLNLEEPAGAPEDVKKSLKMLEKYKIWARGPMGLIFSVVAISGSVILGWRIGVSPILKKRKYKANEEFANFVFEERQKKAAAALENAQQ